MGRSMMQKADDQKVMACSGLFHNVFADTSAAPAFMKACIRGFKHRDAIICQDPQGWVSGMLLAAQRESSSSTQGHGMSPELRMTQLSQTPKRGYVPSRLS